MTPNGPFRTSTSVAAVSRVVLALYAWIVEDSTGSHPLTGGLEGKGSVRSDRSGWARLRFRRLPLVCTPEPEYARLADVKAVIYCRQSVDRDGNELAVSRQLDDGRQLARLRGWHVVRELVENDQSASGRRPRPKFE